MAGPQLAQPIRPWNGYRRTLIDPSASPVIRFEDNEEWNSTDVLIVSAVVRMIYWIKEGSVTLDELATRVKQKTAVGKKYVLTCLPRVLRLPIAADGTIKGIVFQDDYYP